MPIAEKDQTGAWTDYIYANGKKVAQVAANTPVLHHWGVCGNCVGGSSNFVVSGLSNVVSGYTLRPGDTLVFQQKQINARAGLYIYATDGTNSMGNLTDGAGDWVNASSIADGQWHLRKVGLNPWAGKQISGNLGVSVEANTPAGVPWDSQIADIAVVSVDGSVRTLFNGNAQGGTAWNGSAGSQFAMLNTSDASPSTHFYASDQVGTAQMELSSAGVPLWKGEFAPFGQELDQSLTMNRYKFTGKERDAESGLDYFRARYYASGLGRFMSPDWADKPEAVPYSDLSNPQSLNLYAYVGNNPLRRIDPDWHFGLDNGAAQQCLGNATGSSCATESEIQASQQKFGEAQQLHQAAPTNADGTPAPPPTTDNHGEPIVPGVDG